MRNTDKAIIKDTNMIITNILSASFLFNFSIGTKNTIPNNENMKVSVA